MITSTKNLIVCPHCSYEHADWWEYVIDQFMTEGEFTMKCEDCGKEFSVVYDTEVYFYTGKK